MICNILVIFCTYCFGQMKLYTRLALKYKRITSEFNSILFMARAGSEPPIYSRLASDVIVARVVLGKACCNQPKTKILNNCIPTRTKHTFFCHACAESLIFGFGWSVRKWPHSFQQTVNLLFPTGGGEVEIGTHYAAIVSWY